MLANIRFEVNSFKQFISFFLYIHIELFYNIILIKVNNIVNSFILYCAIFIKFLALYVCWFEIHNNIISTLSCYPLSNICPWKFIIPFFLAALKVPTIAYWYKMILKPHNIIMSFHHQKVLRMVQRISHLHSIFLIFKYLF